jgi:hypothetical protein
MIAMRLVRLIEEHSDELARGLMSRLDRHPSLVELRRVPAEELRQRVYEVYRNLSDWLLNKTEGEIEARYTAIGARRAIQGVPLSQVVFALHAVKEYLWEFLQREGLVERHVELFQEIELLRLVERFFDRAIYFAARGYEQAEKARAA